MEDYCCVADREHAVEVVAQALLLLHPAAGPEPPQRGAAGTQRRPLRHEAATFSYCSSDTNKRRQSRASTATLIIAQPWSSTRSYLTVVWQE